MLSQIHAAFLIIKSKGIFSLLIFFVLFTTFEGGYHLLNFDIIFHNDFCCEHVLRFCLLSHLSPFWVSTSQTIVLIKGPCRVSITFFFSLIWPSRYTSLALRWTSLQTAASKQEKFHRGVSLHRMWEQKYYSNIEHDLCKTSVLHTSSHNLALCEM